MIKVSERGIKMDYTVPKNFYEFQYGWYRDIDLHYEAEQLLKVLDFAQKENDIQRYIKETPLYNFLKNKITHKTLSHV